MLRAQPSHQPSTSLILQALTQGLGTGLGSMAGSKRSAALRGDGELATAQAARLAAIALPAREDLRFRCAEIHWPVSTTASRSIPVSIFSPRIR